MDSKINLARELDALFGCTNYTYYKNDWPGGDIFDMQHLRPNTPLLGFQPTQRPTLEELRVWVAKARLHGITITGWWGDDK